MNRRRGKPGTAVRPRRHPAGTAPAGAPVLTLRRLKAGAGAAVLVANGYLTQERQRPVADWEAVLTAHYPAAPWYLVEWRSARMRDLMRDLVVGLAAGPGIPTRALAMVGTLWRRWRLAQQQAAQSGPLLAAHILAAPAGETFVLLGHSLGAAVVFHALRALARAGDAPRVDAVHLLGGAVGAGARGDWEEAATAVAGRVHNYFSASDAILRFLYPSGQLGLGERAIGCQALGVRGGKIVDHDVSAQVASHRAFKTRAAGFLCVP